MEIVLGRATNVPRPFRAGFRVPADEVGFEGQPNAS
jgi:hypothetical protein